MAVLSYRYFFTVGIMLLVVLGPSSALDWMHSENFRERDANPDQELWKILQDTAHLEQNSDEDSYYDEAENEEQEDDELLSLADRSLDSGSRDNRRPKLVLCQVIKEKREYGTPLIKYKPSVVESYVCRKSNVEFSSFKLEDFLMEYSGGHKPSEFCILHTSHAHHHLHRNCYTKTTQVSLFSRRFNSTEWSHESRKIGVGCGCEIGLKYYD